MKQSSWLVAILALLVVAAPGATARESERSPFESIRWTDAGPQIQVDATWYELVSLDGISYHAIAAACQRLDQPQWKRRFTEDLVAALGGAGHQMGTTVTLVVRTPGSQATRSLTRVPMTATNRERLRRAAAYNVGPRIERAHASRVDPRYAFLTRRIDVRDSANLSAEQAQADLDQLEWQIEHTYSYRDLAGVDYRAALDTIRVKLGASISVAELGIQLRKFVALFGDGHARVRGVSPGFPAGRLPVALIDTREGVVALTAKGVPLDPDHPFVAAIDGKPLQAWIEAAKQYNARGSAGLQRLQALQWLRYINLFRSELDLPHRPEATFALVGPSGTATRAVPVAKRTVRVAARRPRIDLPPDIARVLIPKMDRNPSRALDAIHDAATRAKALILDVRGNGGGSRALLAQLMPHLLPEDAKPVICNVAAYRMPPGSIPPTGGGYLSNRYLNTDLHLRSQAEITVAAALRRTFKPDWNLDRTMFAPWELMVVSPAPKGAWRFEGPTAILIDNGCFSATDIFVGALEVLPQVTLVGTTTGGGSGRAQRFRLAHSRFEVQLSSMASFRPSGQRYDGKGIQPDLSVAMTCADARGQTDAVLSAAVAHLRTILSK